MGDFLEHTIAFQGGLIEELKGAVAEFLNRGQVLNLEFLKRNGRLNLVQTTISK